MPTEHSLQEIQALISRCESITEILKQLHTEMAAPGPAKIRLNSATAAFYLEKVEGWSQRALAKHRREQPKPTT